MPEVNAYRCDFCHKLMEPVEKNDGRWHTKWCSACGAKLYDVFVGAPTYRHFVDKERYECRGHDCPACKAGNLPR